MKTILFFIPSLASGGAERVLVHIMNNLDRDRFHVHLAMFRKRGVFLDDLRDDITIHELKTGILGAFFIVPACIRRIRPDIVCSTICDMNMVLGISRLHARSPRVLFVARESGMPSLRGVIEKSIWNKPWLYRTAYRQLDYIICQSNGMRDDVHEFYRVPLRKIITINNPIDVDSIQKQALEGNTEGFSTDAINILSVGRLHPVKGFDMLLSALARTTNRRLHLHVIGEGKLADELGSLATDLGIAGRVTFHGFKKNPYPYMRAADLLVISSVSEGFPNAVMEALSLGCPVLAFDCPGGIGELVEEGISGFLIQPGDIDALAREMDRGAYKDLDREMISERVIRRYDISMIMKQYEDLFEKGCAVQ